MKNADEAIGQVLAGLRDVDAPIGMERRVLDAVQDRASVKSARMPPWVWGTALACAMVTCVAISIVYRAARVPVQSNGSSVPAVVVPKVALEAATKNVSPVLTAQSVRSKTNVKVKRAKVVRDGDTAALRAMQAASFPAPPMPLTEQEKLLLRVVHHRDPEELAMLNQEMRDKREEDNNAEFQRFFEPVTTGDTE
jgi:hypothetical protein